MSNLYLCPKCNTQLIAPPGAAQIRCPKCKTVLSITPQAEPEQPATASAPPLPFGPKPAKAKAPTEESPKAKKKVKVRVVDEKAEEEARQAKEAAEKKKKMRAELAEMEEKEEEEKEEYEVLKVHCRRGRLALDFMIWGIRAQAFAVFLEVVVMLTFVMAFMTAVLGAASGKIDGASTFLEALGLFLKLVIPLAGLLSLLAVTGMITGFGIGIAGPPKGIRAAIIGLVFSILHVLFVIAQAIFAIGRIIWKARNDEPLVDPNAAMWQQAGPIFDLCGMITELPLLSEHPARFAWNYSISYFGIIAGAMEFVRLVSICLLAQMYAELGKAGEKGHKALKGAYRCFWLMLLAGIFRLVAAFAFDGFRPDSGFMILLGIAVHGLITLCITLGLAMILYFLSQALEDIKEVVEAPRYAAKGAIAEL